MIIIAAENGPKTWGYAKVGDAYISFWSSGKTIEYQESKTAASFEMIWKQKRTSSGGFKALSSDDALRKRLPSLEEKFYA